MVNVITYYCLTVMTQQTLEKVNVFSGDVRIITIV